MTSQPLDPEAEEPGAPLPEQPTPPAENAPETPPAPAPSDPLATIRSELAQKEQQEGVKPKTGVFQRVTGWLRRPAPDQPAETPSAPELPSSTGSAGSEAIALPAPEIPEPETKQTPDTLSEPSDWGRFEFTPETTGQEPEPQQPAEDQWQAEGPPLLTAPQERPAAADTWSSLRGQLLEPPEESLPPEPPPGIDLSQADKSLTAPPRPSLVKRITTWFLGKPADEPAPLDDTLLERRLQTGQLDAQTQPETDPDALPGIDTLDSAKPETAWDLLGEVPPIELYPPSPAEDLTGETQEDQQPQIEEPQESWKSFFDSLPDEPEPQIDEGREERSEDMLARARLWFTEEPQPEAPTSWEQEDLTAADFGFPQAPASETIAETEFPAASMQEPETLFKAPEIAAEPEPERKADESYQDLRKTALEDYAEPSPEAALPVVQQSGLGGWLRGLSGWQKTGLAVLLIFELAIVVALAMLVSRPQTIIAAIQPTTQPSATPTPRYPFPVELRLPGGWPFSLGRGEVSGGVWNPQGPEWLAGTEIVRWVAIPWNKQLEAVVRSLEPGDRIELTMSTADRLSYKIESINQVPRSQVSAVDPGKPALIVVLSNVESDQRWVIVATTEP